jgi:chromate transporter
MRFPIGKKTGITAWVIFFLLLVGLPLVRQLAPSHALELFDSFFRVGSLVFGGGHVVLPLLQTEVAGYQRAICRGYGATRQCGPLYFHTLAP